MQCKAYSQDIEDIILDGFFPAVDINGHPKKKIRAGINRFSLNYAQDPAISKHLALFLSKQASQSESFVSLKVVLFNGGVFKPTILHQQLILTLIKWLKKAKNRSQLSLWA